MLRPVFWLEAYMNARRRPVILGLEENGLESLREYFGARLDMPHILNLKLSFTGEEAENNQLDFYDTAQALMGFERSLALTTHLILNGKIITQAPSLQGAKIYAIPPEEGSWEIIAGIVTVSATALYKLGTAPRDTPLGNLISSAYDYVVRRTMGFRVNYEQTLGQQLEDANRNDGAPEITEQRLDSLIEKTETAVRQMHRPIVESQTASKATIFSLTRTGQRQIARPLTLDTYERMQLVDRSREVELEGSVSSYNINTYKGRMYVDDEQRPIPFELAESNRDEDTITIIASSLARNATNRIRQGRFRFRAYKYLTSTGRLKALNVTEML